MHRANTIHYAEPDLEHPNVAVRALVDSSDVRPGPALVREGDARAQVVIDQTEEEKVGKTTRKKISSATTRSPGTAMRRTQLRFWWS